MNAPRPFVVVLIVVLVVLVGIYALGLGKGLQGTRVRMQDLKDRFGSARAIPLQELSRSGGCSAVPPAQLSIRPGETCQLEAKAARSWSRRDVVLFSAQPLFVRVRPVEKDGPAVEVEGDIDPTSDPRKSPRFAIPSGGAIVFVRCKAGAPGCTLLVSPP